MAAKQPSLTPEEVESKRAEEEADKAALARLYGPKVKSKDAKGQLGIGIALLVLGPAFIAWGAAAHGEPRLIAVGVVAFGVGIWSTIDGTLRASRARKEERNKSR